jgi:hypothetical protein
MEESKQILHPYQYDNIKCPVGSVACRNPDWIVLEDLYEGQ